jgi:tungstate transport system substrate-binding protein
MSKPDRPNPPRRSSALTTPNRRWRLLALIPLLVLASTVITSVQSSMILATTTSTQDSGLLDVLVPQFEKQTGITVKVIAMGTGAALRIASSGDADAVLVHAPDAEKKFIDAGDLVDGRRIMHNDYVIVGPEEDPAGVAQQTSVAGAMRTIADRGVFISRGDDSGTHKQELTLWTAAGVDAGAISRREETGQGMGATLNVADQRRAYTLTDRGTYLSLRKRLRLRILFQGDPTLQNIYHAHVVNPQKHRRINADAARAFVRFLVSPGVQRTIGHFRRKEFGEPLFFPDALPAKHD